MTAASIQTRTEMLAKMRHWSIVYGSLLFVAPFLLLCLFIEMPASAMVTLAALCGGGCLLALKLGSLLGGIREKCERGEITDQQWQFLVELPKVAALRVAMITVGCAFAVGSLYLLQNLM